MLPNHAHHLLHLQKIRPLTRAVLSIICLKLVTARIYKAPRVIWALWGLAIAGLT